jgi:DNA-binding response OmpR family regulator
LIIDDDPAIRHLLRIMLEVEGHTVLEAEDGYAGITLASTHHPDVVVLDYMMPGADGESTGLSLRRVAPTSRVVAFSAVLVSQPYWAHAFLCKQDVDQLPDIIALDPSLRGAAAG